MITFVYDKTFEGLLTVVFDAYYLKQYPDVLLSEKENLPLFCENPVYVVTDTEKSGRVWKALEKKMSKGGLSFISAVWCSELPFTDILLFRFIRKNIDSPISQELNFGDSDVLEVSKLWKKVQRERLHLLQFIRFQKTKDGIYFAACEPIYNVLPFITDHFRDRYADQPWVIYDMRRHYGYYYDLRKVEEIQFSELPYISAGHLDDKVLADDERLFQHFWHEYFKVMTIKERINPKLHRQNLPVRFWKYLIEKN